MYNLLTQRTVNYFSELTHAAVPDLVSLEACLGLWNHSFLTNDLRNFLFLLCNDSLPLNNRLNAFDPEVQPSCNFCRIIDRETAPWDGFYHFFFSCPISNRLLREWHWCWSQGQISTLENFLTFIGSGASNSMIIPLIPSHLSQISLNTACGSLNLEEKSRASWHYELNSNFY